jgi:hypothetical protein
MIGKKLLDEFETSQNSDLITTSIDNPCIRITGGRCSIKALHWWKIWGSPTTLGTTMQTSCIKGSSYLSQPQRLSKSGCTLGFLTTITLRRLRTLLQHTNFLGLDLPCQRTMVTRVQTLLRTLLGCPQHPLLLVWEWQVPEVELLELPIDSLVETYIGHYAATTNSALG